MPILCVSAPTLRAKTPNKPLLRARLPSLVHFDRVGRAPVMEHDQVRRLGHLAPDEPVALVLRKDLERPSGKQAHSRAERRTSSILAGVGKSCIPSVDAWSGSLTRKNDEIQDSHTDLPHWEDRTVPK
eukprot:6164675-Pleurochrysis_carterae.AAC.2